MNSFMLYHYLIFLCRVSNASGQIKVDQVGAGALKYELLDSNVSSFLIQTTF